ncbi:MAG TPA: long-chain fatty acid--CoA ligase [Gemmatimonadales bacterium]|nr:long-chain fatty acid--CoA ligase [Gemmatimonadales bacterium]
MTAPERIATPGTSRVWHAAYDAGVPASLSYEPLTVPQLLEQAAARYPDRPAVMFLNCRLTYAQLYEDVRRLATALARLGVEHDTRVAIQLPNIPQAVIAYYATLSLGAQAVMTNPLYVQREIEHQWTDADCRVAFVTDFLYDRTIRSLRDRLPVKQYVVASIPEYLRFPLSILAPLKLRRMRPPALARVAPDRGVHFFRSLVQGTPADPPHPDIGLDDLAVLQYTGGTTGVAKGAMLTQRNLSSNVQQIRAWMPDLALGREVFMTALPLFHSFGMTVCMNLPVYAGAAMVLVPNPRDIVSVLAGLERGVTIFPAAPALFNAILNHRQFRPDRLHRIRYCVSGAAPLPVELLRRFETATGGVIAEGFGLTETSPCTHVNPLQGKRKVGSVGIPLPDTDAKIVDLTDGRTEMPLGQEGELLVRGPQIMKGYWHRPDETALTIRSGWLYTGDIARVDEDGYTYIVGRKKEMIIVSGFKVFPDEVDGILMRHPAVLESATIGLPDPQRGERVKSFVVVKPGQAATVEDLIAHCRSELAPYKVPKEIEFRAELPKSAAFKVLRRELRAEATAHDAGG